LKTLLATLIIALPLFAQQPSLGKKAIAEIVRYNERWPQGSEIRVEDTSDQTELPHYRKILAQLVLNNSVVAQKTYYVTPDGSRVITASVFELDRKPFSANLDRMHLSDAPAYGPATATVTVVLFSDFECPFCANDAKMFRDGVPKDFPGQVRVLFKDYPMSMHPWAMDAAIAGRCIYHVSTQKFWDYYDWIFTHQREINAQNVKGKIMEWAGAAPIDSATLDKCITSRATEAEVKQSMADGLALEVDGTPATFLNGRVLEPGRDWDVIKYYINYELKAAPQLESCCTVKLPVKPPK
jgi:protein-disulfide isomerase